MDSPRPRLGVISLAPPDNAEGRLSRKIERMLVIPKASTTLDLKQAKALLDELGV
jgi:hypothetical protein